MISYIPQISSFSPPSSSPELLFDLPEKDIQTSLSHLLGTSVFLRKKTLLLKKESKKRRMHSVIARATRLASDQGLEIQKSASLMAFDSLWDFLDQTLNHRIKKLALSPATAFEGSILKPLSTIDISPEESPSSEVESSPEQIQQEDNTTETDIPLDFDHMEKFVSENMKIEEEDQTNDYFDSLGEESDDSVAAKDMKFSDFFKPIDQNPKPTPDDIKNMEKELIAPKHWSLRGEATSKSRPENSLLELDLEFLFNQKEQGDTTNLSQEDSTTSVPLEMIIKQRIQSKVFDNVEPKNISIIKLREERNADTKDDDDLVYSKDERGLATIYAEKYRNEVIKEGNANDELSKDKLEIANLFSKIIYKLDSLSNLNFLPSKPMDLSAKTGEDVVPLLIAKPLTGYAEKEHVKNKGEMDRDEKKSLRRINKERYKKKALKNGKIDENTQNLSKKDKKIEIHENTKRLDTAKLLQKKASGSNKKL